MWRKDVFYDRSHKLLGPTDETFHNDAKKFCFVLCFNLYWLMKAVNVKFVLNYNIKIGLKWNSPAS